MKSFFLSLLLLISLSAPAFADVTVSAPTSGASVVSPFAVVAKATPCKTQPIVAMAYSLDTGRDTIVKALSINVSEQAALGNHIVRVKSWGNRGALCEQDLPIIVVSPVPPSTITSVQVACSPTTIAVSTTSQCVATVQGTGGFSSTVTWSGASSSGVFTAPASAGSATVTAVSTQDPSKSGTAAITVSSGAPAIPVNAVAADLIGLTHPWKPCEHDAGTPGTGTCSSNYPVTGITTNDVRGFSMAYTGAGGVRWANSFAKDTVATHFVYDTEVISPDWTHTANLELDTNQVKATGKTAILGTQCATYTKTWEVTFNKPDNSAWHWVPTNVPCDPTKWAPNVPHHIRIFGTIDASGISTYTGVELDEVYTAFTGATGLTARPLGWGIGSVLTNFQIDGLGASGSATIYATKLTIYRW
jgi:hypothetical protein